MKLEMFFDVIEFKQIYIYIYRILKILKYIKKCKMRHNREKLIKSEKIWFEGL